MDANFFFFFSFLVVKEISKNENVTVQLFLLGGYYVFHEHSRHTRIETTLNDRDTVVIVV